MTKKPSLLDRMTTAQKTIVVGIAIIGTLWGAGKVAIVEVREVFKEISQDNASETKRQLEQMGFLTVEQFLHITDSLIISEIEANRIANDSLHMRSYKGQDRIIFAIEDAKYSDAELIKKIERIEARLNEIKGIALTDIE